MPDPAMPLTVFDIDGTLCQTSGLDDACWRTAAQDVLGIKEMSTDWSHYPHSTDESIAGALIREHHGVEPDRALLDRLRDHFVGLLEKAHAKNSDCIRATPGARRLLSTLDRQSHPVAIATGGWTPSARLKLSHSGIDWEGVPSAFACDAHPREQIISLAIDRAADLHRCTPADFGRIVYVGDGIWDLKATRALGISFVGLARGQRAELLGQAGAMVIHEDFQDLDSLLASLGGA